MMATIATRSTSRAKVRLGLRSSGVSISAEEFDAWPTTGFDSKLRYELIRGVLVVTPPPGNGEVDPNQYLGYLLISYQENHCEGRLIDLTLPEQTLPTQANRRRCDRAIWVGLGRVPNLMIDFPAIVIEFVSQSRRDFRRDYEEKRDEYRQAGALEYWIIDRFRRIMTIYRFAQGEAQPETITTVVAADSYRTNLLPGFVLPFDQLLKRSDLYTPPPRTKRKPRPPAPEGDPR